MVFILRKAKEAVVTTISQTLGVAGPRNWNKLRHQNEAISRFRQRITSGKYRTILFGGALGFDTDALEFAYRIRGGKLTPGSKGHVRLVVVCPDTLKELPNLAYVAASKYADEHVELKHPITADDNFEAYKARNRYIVDHSGTLDFYWDGRSQGTGHGIAYAKRQGTQHHVYTVSTVTK